MSGGAREALAGEPWLVEVDDLRVAFPGAGRGSRGGRGGARGVVLARGRRLPRAGRRVGFGQERDGAGAARAGRRQRVGCGKRLQLAGRDGLTLDARGWRALRGREVGLVLQDALVALDPLRRVGAEVAEAVAAASPLARGRAARAAREARVLELLTAAGVPEPELRARQRPHELSGGLRQRALIASALAGRPRLLIADEPTTALDVTVQARILDLLAETKAAGTGLLLISHDLAVVARLADRIAVMAAGEIVEQGPREQILHDPPTRSRARCWRRRGRRSSRARRRPPAARPAPPPRGSPPPRSKRARSSSATTTARRSTASR